MHREIAWAGTLLGVLAFNGARADDRPPQTQAGATITRYTYDDAGNLLSRDGPHGRVEYVYDDANRLIETRDARGRTIFAYNVDGVRVKQTRIESGVAITDHYLIDANRPQAQVVEQWRSRDGAAPQLARVFTQGDEPLAQTDCEAPTAMGCGGAVTRYLHADGTGSTRLITDNQGHVATRFLFDAFGNLLERTGNADIALLFRGEAFDPNIGFYYLRARYLDPLLGRFTQGDPLQGTATDPTSLHRYGYANNDPMNRVDPSGRSGLAENATALTIAATLATVAAVATYQVLQPVHSSDKTRVFGLWDAVALSYFGVGHAQASAKEKEKDTATEIAVVAATRRYLHHTIPIYLCGAVAQENYAGLLLNEHLAVHAALAQIRLALKAAENFAYKTIGRHRALDLLRIAQTEPGRKGIADAIGYVYSSGDWLEEGDPKIGPAFAVESKRFIAGYTSLPWCTRNGNP